MQFDNREILADNTQNILIEIASYAIEIDEKDLEVTLYHLNPKDYPHPFPETLINTIRKNIRPYLTHNSTVVQYSANRTLDKLLTYEKHWNKKLLPSE